MRKIQQGFTLIELVVVITILGILAAFAIPRFAALDSAARAATVNGLAGSLRSAAALAHSLYLTQGTTPTSVSMEGTAVTLSNGYPDAILLGITAALQDTSGFTATYAAGVATFARNGAPTATATTCQVTYTAATTTAAPVVVAPVTGC